MSTPTKATAIEKLDRCMRARYPIVGLVSHEESRVLAAIDAIANKRGRTVATWAITNGLQNVTGIDPDRTRDPIPALEAILNYNPDAEPVLFVMKDMHSLMNDPMVVGICGTSPPNSKAAAIPHSSFPNPDRTGRFRENDRSSGLAAAGCGRTERYPAQM